MKRCFIAWLLVVVLAGGCKPSDAPIATPGLASLPTEAQPRLSTIKLYLGAEEMVTEIARTGRQQECGMMFRTNMAENEGMIFLLPYPMRASFWMKNCSLPLSAAYIDPGGTIVEIHALQPHDTNSVVAAADNIQYVLETPQGWFARHNITPGAAITTEKGPLKQVFGGIDEMKVALAQINTTVGDLAGNEVKILAAYRRGVEAGVELVMFPELTIAGYPPRDLLLKKSFIAGNFAVLQRLAEATGKTAMLVGFVGENKTRPGREVNNSVALLQNGKIVAVRTKTLLPTYDVFDEDRYFEPATENTAVELNGGKVGLTICEDIWNDGDFWPERRYKPNPPVDLAAAGAEIILNISASPWSVGKDETRYEMLRSLALKTKRPVVFCNQIGGNDELVFDGGSLAFNGAGELLGYGQMFAEDFVVVDTTSKKTVTLPKPPVEEYIYKALVLGLRDYLHKCGFKSAVLGLSGGIDSALVAALAVAALGKENVRGVSLPSQFSSQGSLDDARILAENLGIHYEVIPIQAAFLVLKKEMRPAFEGKAEDTTEENIQARLRGVILMALSNKFGSLLLTTGNKSELAVGYCTLYGDMCGGLAVISDVPKTMVYRLSKWINLEKMIIPEASITKAPSAELRPNQTDQDSLPPYDVLDAILDAYVVQGKTASEIIASGFEEAAVKRVVRLIDFNEYKRRQAAPGLKVTSKAFGVGRRIPIAQKYQAT